MRGLLYSNECETRKEYHLTGGPPPRGTETDTLAPLNLETGGWERLRSAVRPVRLLSTTLLSFTSPPETNHTPLVSLTNLGKTLAPGLPPQNLSVSSLHAGSAVSTVRSAAGTANTASA